MADLENARCRLRLTESELADVQTMRADPALPGWAREALATVAEPGLRIIVKIFTANRPLVQSIWATPRIAVIGTRTDDGRIELTSIEPVLIPFALAQMVGLRRRPAASDRSAIRVRAATYLAMQQRVFAPHPQPPNGNPSELPPADAAALSTLFRRRLMTWRATAAWRDRAEGRVVRTVHVADAGVAGLWQITAENASPEGPVLLVEPVRTRDVWAKITDLLPGKRSVTRQEFEADR